MGRKSSKVVARCTASSGTSWDSRVPEGSVADLVVILKAVDELLGLEERRPACRAGDSTEP